MEGEFFKRQVQSNAGGDRFVLLELVEIIALVTVLIRC